MQVANHRPSCPLGQHREAPTATHVGRVVPVGHRKVSDGWSKWENLARARVRRVGGGDSPNTCFDDASVAASCGLAERRGHEPRRRNRLQRSPLPCDGRWAAVTPYSVLKRATGWSLLAPTPVTSAPRHRGTSSSRLAQRSTTRCGRVETRPNTGFVNLTTLDRVVAAVLYVFAFARPKSRWEYGRLFMNI